MNGGEGEYVFYSDNEANLVDSDEELNDEKNALIMQQNLS